MHQVESAGFLNLAWHTGQPRRVRSALPKIAWTCLNWVPLPSGTRKHRFLHQNQHLGIFSVIDLLESTVWTYWQRIFGADESRSESSTFNIQLFRPNIDGKNETIGGICLWICFFHKSSFVHLFFLNLETTAKWASSDVQHVQCPSNGHLQQDTSKKQRTNIKCLVVK